MKFTYKKLNGEYEEADFSSLQRIAEGPVPLANGWQGDRVNFSTSLSIFIEFRSGPEEPPGFVSNEAIEVSKEYVDVTYKKSKF